MKTRLGRKGSVLDIFFAVLIGMVVVITTLVAVFLYDNVSSAIISVLPNNTVGTNVTTETINKVYVGFQAMDYVFMIVFFMLCLSPIILSLFVLAHPVFMVINIVLILVLFLVFPVMSNVVHEFWTQPSFAQYATGGGGSVTFPIMTSIFEWLPIIGSVMGILVMVVMYAKGGTV